jgi:hypothetical protein
MHEVVELVKALAWPCVAFYFLVRFAREIRLLLIEVPNLISTRSNCARPGCQIRIRSA